MSLSTLRFCLTQDQSGRFVECAVLIHSAKGARVGVVDVRELAALPLRYGEGRLAIKVRISSLPLVEGAYTVGLVLVTDGGARELLEICDFSVGAGRPSVNHLPYPPELRGLIVLDATTSVSFPRQQEIA